MEISGIVVSPPMGFVVESELFLGIREAYSEKTIRDTVRRTYVRANTIL